MKDVDDVEERKKSEEIFVHGRVAYRRLKPTNFFSFLTKLFYVLFEVLLINFCYVMKHRT